MQRLFVVNDFPAAIFDSADGGMVAATLPVLREWKAGTLSDEGLWRRCYFDPAEMFHATGQ